LVIAVVALLRAATARKRSTALILPMIRMAAPAFALTVRNEVAKAPDAYADGFIERHSCRSTFAVLSAAHEGWEQDRGPMPPQLRKFGAVRTISYQENGLLKFGFPYDDSRSVWLPEYGAA